MGIDLADALLLVLLGWILGQLRWGESLIDHCVYAVMAVVVLLAVLMISGHL